MKNWPVSHYGLQPKNKVRSVAAKWEPLRSKRSTECSSSSSFVLFSFQCAVDGISLQVRVVEVKATGNGFEWKLDKLESDK